MGGRKQAGELLGGRVGPDNGLFPDLSDLYMSVHFIKTCYTYTYVLDTFLCVQLISGYFSKDLTNHPGCTESGLWQRGKAGAQ